MRMKIEVQTLFLEGTHQVLYRSFRTKVTHQQTSPGRKDLPMVVFIPVIFV
uniref:Uncharacterized protein n=1 Tax=Picea glauca TaxID=3330 RepID=A0A101M134_PICGL|nr:hypothetical protein ABT39_MTgene4323 [Picea glauca]QHR88451.1 hypothetical protein Q903MT_gene2464 [Picea sitchensis]